MREQFQTAFSDLVASPDLVKQVRRDPDMLRERYDITELEERRLIAIANQTGMECSCVLYRANRLAPLAINLPDLCKELGTQLRELLSEYWIQTSQISDNFWVEAHDFCQFVRSKVSAGVVPGSVLSTLEREEAAVIGQLAEIYPERYAAGTV